VAIFENKLPTGGEASGIENPGVVSRKINEEANLGMEMAVLVAMGGSGFNIGTAVG
jgi:hypothetical protein